MKRGLKTTLCITGSIAGALVLTIIILSVIVVRPLSPFTSGDYSINVMNSTENAQNQLFEDEIKDKLSSVRFSIMRSLLEMNADYKIKPVKVTVDGEEENKKISASTFLSFAPSGGQFMLKLEYGETQTNSRFKKDNGDLIKFDSLVIIINESNETIQPVLLYPYMAVNLKSPIVDLQTGEPLDEENEDGEINAIYYNVYEFSAKMYTSQLYDHLLDLGLRSGVSQQDS